MKEQDTEGCFDGEVTSNQGDIQNNSQNSSFELFQDKLPLSNLNSKLDHNLNRHQIGLNRDFFTEGLLSIANHQEMPLLNLLDSQKNSNVQKITHKLEMNNQKSYQEMQHIGLKPIPSYYKPKDKSSGKKQKIVFQSEPIQKSSDIDSIHKYKQNQNQEQNLVKEKAQNKQEQDDELHDLQSDIQKIRQKLNIKKKISDYNNESEQSAISGRQSVVSGRQSVISGRQSLISSRQNLLQSQDLKPCRCKKQRCLKLYCDCFKNGVRCQDNCECQGCYNNDKHEAELQKAIEITLKHNPRAFLPKVSDENFHKVGCNCKHSQCLKKYCECFQIGISCGQNCQCINCKNIENPKQINDKTLKKVKS